MQKVKASIAKIMFNALRAYAEACADICKNPCFGVPVDANDFEVYAADIMYNDAALQQFIENGNAEQLYTAIVKQDSAVADAFVDVLHFLEKHNLVSMRTCS